MLRGLVKFFSYNASSLTQLPSDRHNTAPALSVTLPHFPSHATRRPGPKELDNIYRLLTGSGTHQASYTMGAKRPERDADHSPLPSAEVKNVWSYTSTQSIRFHGMVLS